MPKLFGAKQDPKNPKHFKGGNSSEILKDSQGVVFSSESPKASFFGLKGVLRPGQTVELGQNNNRQEGPAFVNYLDRETQILIDNRQHQIKKEIDDLKDEIKKLTNVTENLDRQISTAASQTIAEASEYQIRFFQRLKNLITNLRHNIADASIWLSAFTAKKKKRNYFWSTVKNKKGGGEQYLFSNEHSAARSAT